MKLRNEPALIVGFVQALLALAVSFGLNLSVEQVGSVVALVAAVTAVLLRQQVSPAAPPAQAPERSMTAEVVQ